jgi:hypothetical protein
MFTRANCQDAGPVFQGKPKFDAYVIDSIIEPSLNRFGLTGIAALRMQQLIFPHFRSGPAHQAVLSFSSARKRILDGFRFQRCQDRFLSF